MKQKLHLLQLEWEFNPPAAPHFGGSWERLVKVFKDSLYKVIGSRKLHHETMSTFCCEIESCMNSRPLIYVSSDFKDDEPLTPNHFILGRPSLNFSPIISFPQHIKLNKTWRDSQTLANHYWNRFLREYLPTQQTRSKWTKTRAKIEPGDLVWILEDFTPRGLWPIAKVIKVFPGKDGIVRSCEIKTCTGTKIRPVIKLSRIFADESKDLP